MLAENDIQTLKEKQIERAVNAYGKVVSDGTLMNNAVIMGVAYRFPEIFPNMLNTFFGKELGIDPATIRLQEIHPSEHGNKEIFMDIAAKTKDGVDVVLEVENNPKFNELRLRYYIAKKNSTALEVGEDYGKMRPLMIAIVEKSGILDNSLPRCFESTILTQDENSLEGKTAFVKNGQTIVRINAGYQNEHDNSKLADYIHDFNCQSGSDCKIKNVGEALSAVKGQNDKEWVRNMLYSYQGMTDRVLSEEEYMAAKEKAKIELRDEVKAEVKAEIRDKVKAEVKAEIRDKVKAEVKAEIRDEVISELRGEASKYTVYFMLSNGISPKKIPEITSIDAKTVNSLYSIYKQDKAAIHKKYGLKPANSK